MSQENKQEQKQPSKLSGCIVTEIFIPIIAYCVYAIIQTMN